MMATIPRWNLRNLPRTREESIEWAEQQHLLPTSKRCRKHRHTFMRIDRNIGVAGRFRCRKSNMCFQPYVANGTFFSNSNMPLERIIGIMYAFSQDWSYDQVRREMIDLSKPDEERNLLSKDTIHFWYRYCREMVVDHFIGMQIETYGEHLGGPGSVVQIDESLFGHRKYHRGRNLNGKWVLGMIEDGKEDVRMVVVDQRDAETLIPIIKEHVQLGTEIHTDCWKAYDRLEEAGYIHKTVNHSDLQHRFVAPDGTHTQRIEATWRPAKDWFRGRHVGKDQFADHLCQYLWQRHCKKNDVDTFESLISAIAASYTV